MNILDEIIEHKKKEVARCKKERSLSVLEGERFYRRNTLSLSKYIKDSRKTGVIAEFKRKSPSKGVINNRNSVEAITRAYAAYGASGISILTDHTFFGGSLDDLVSARDNHIPLLRKEFVIDPYQVYESKAFGADAILLIAACLDKNQVKELVLLAHELDLQVLLEVHNESELDRVYDEVDLIGVNNRDLKNFEVNFDNSIRLIKSMGKGSLKIAESGINSVEDVRRLRSAGFDGCLIGEYFMKQENPMMAFKNFSYEL